VRAYVSSIFVELIPPLQIVRSVSEWLVAIGMFVRLTVMVPVLMAGFMLVMPDFLWPISGFVFLSEISLFSVILFAVLLVVFLEFLVLLFSFRPLMVFFERGLKGR
jgi:hypothetical protein